MRLRRLGMRAVALASCYSLVGCNTLGLMNFDQAANSGKPSGDIQVLLPATAGTSGGVAAADQLSGFGAAVEAYQRNCGPVPSQPEVAAAAVILLPVVGELLFGLAADWAGRRADALKEASEASYAGRVNMSSADLRALVADGRCIAIVRFDPPGKQTAAGGVEPKRVALVAVLKLAPAAPGRTDSFVFRPIYVSASNSAAITRQSEAPAVTVGLGLSVKSIGKQDNGLPGSFLVGQAASAAPKVLLNAGESSCLKSACATSEPIPIPVGPDGLVSLGVGVTEKGSLGFDTDVAKAQIGAIKAAIGPVIGELIKKKISPDSE
jgi:hypothetical protein